MTERSYRDHLTPEHRARLEREDARAALRECAMPLCTGESIYDPEQGNLGICLRCALDVGSYFDRIGDVPALTERKLQRRYRELERDKQAAEKAESRSIKAGWIYYIQVDQRIKIGYSTDVRERMRAYPPHAELLAVHPGTRTLEGDMHARFVGSLAAGREWFRPSPEVLGHIDSVIEEFGEPEGRHIYKFREGTRRTIKPHPRSRH